MKLISLVSAIGLLSLLNACGGGGGGGTLTAVTENTVSGYAIDGYLSMAEVCIDLNDNFLCDQDEPSTLTDTSGRYTLTNVTQDQLKSHSILVYARAGVTVDLDNPIHPIVSDYLLTAPPGSLDITPLTSLIKAEMVLNKVDEATARVNTYNKLFVLGDDAWKTGLNYGNLYQNYIKSGNFALQKIAASILEKKSVFTGADYYADITAYLNDLSHFAAEYVGPNINQIVASNTISDAKLVMTNALALGTPDFRAGISELRDLGGSSGFRVRTSVFTPSTATLTTSDNYAINQTRFVAQSLPAMNYWELVNSTWQSVPSSIKVNASAWSLTGGEFGTSGVGLSVEQIDLNNKNFDFSSLNRSGISQTFPAGSKGYYLNYVTKTPRYILGGNPLTDPSQVQLRTLEELIAAYSSSSTPSWVNALQSSTGLIFTFTPTDATKGIISFRNPDVPNQVAMSGGKYVIETVNGNSLLFISQIPSAILKTLKMTNPSAVNDLSSDGTAEAFRTGARPFFTKAPDGTIREGLYTQSRVATSPSMLLNRTALNSVLKALSLCQLDSNYADSYCP